MHRSSIPIDSHPIDPDRIPFLHLCYDDTTEDVSDTTMVWSSQVDMTRMREFLMQLNTQSSVIVSPSAVLARAVALALAAHPQANCRLVGHRLHYFREQNILLPVKTPNGTALTLLRGVDQLSYEEVASRIQQEAIQARNPHSPANRAARWGRQLPDVVRRCGTQFLLWLCNNWQRPITSVNQHLTGAPVMINYFGFPCAPPLIAYKPSRFASRSLLMNVTLGPAHPQPAVVDGEVQVRPIAGLFVRVDHRTMDAQEFSDFVGTIVKILTAPDSFDHEPTTSSYGGDEMEIQASRNN